MPIFWKCGAMHKENTVKCSSGMKLCEKGGRMRLVAEIVKHVHKKKPCQNQSTRSLHSQATRSLHSQRTVIFTPKGLPFSRGGIPFQYRYLRYDIGTGETSYISY